MEAITQLTTAASGVAKFDFEGRSVRGIEWRGDAWVVAQDLCAILGIHRTAVRKIEDEDKLVHLMHTPSGDQEMVLLNESGAYTLILRCREAMTPGTTAYKVRKWVCGEVLPSIRKTGKYSKKPEGPKRQRLELFMEDGRVISSRTIGMYDINVNFDDDQSVLDALRYLPLDRMKRVTELVNQHVLGIYESVRIRAH